MRVRMNISIPSELRTRMDAVDVPMNWSSVAAQAFEEVLRDLEIQKKAEELDEIAERLRKSKTRGVNELLNKGLEDGRDWARSLADALELRRLSDERRMIGRHWKDFWHGKSSYGPSERFYFLIAPELAGDRRLAEGFWSSVLGPSMNGFHNDPHYVGGFADGAIDLWGQVADKV